jgi:hypothetical protein
MVSTALQQTSSLPIILQISDVTPAKQVANIMTVTQTQTTVFLAAVVKPKCFTRVVSPATEKLNDSVAQNMAFW